MPTQPPQINLWVLQLRDSAWNHAEDAVTIGALVRAQDEESARRVLFENSNGDERWSNSKHSTCVLVGTTTPETVNVTFPDLLHKDVLLESTYTA